MGELRDQHCFVVIVLLIVLLQQGQLARTLTCYMASQAWHDYWLGLNSQVNAADRSSVTGSLISEDIVSQVVIPPL